MASLAERSARGRQVLVAGVAVNCLLALLKLGAGWIGNSNALVADGLESTLDVLSSAMIWGALKYAERPPDSDHPYGHGKMESLAGAGGALLLLIAGVLVATGSLKEILAGALNRPPPAAFTLAVLVAVVVIKEGLFRLGRRRGREVESSAVQSDAWHHRSDALTSLAAAIGITVEGVDNVEKCRVRKSGLSLIADIHVRVQGEVTVTDGHFIAHRVKDALMGGGFNILDVTVHIEPA